MRYSAGVTLQTLRRLRLRNHWLTGTTRRTPREVVAHFGAIQSQEFDAATWAIGLRALGISQADVIRAYDAGEIVRTHVLRPTWHFVAAADVRWMLALTAGRLRAAARKRFDWLGLDERVVSRCLGAIERALGEGTPLTRAELATRMRSSGTSVSGQQPYHLTFEAELAGLICSGPMRGSLFTFDLLERRVPPGPALDRHEALALLARRYFASHGPATLHDFAWWSGLTMGDVRRAVQIVGSELEPHDVDGAAMLAIPSRIPSGAGRLAAHLIPCFDELTVGYRDRRAVAGSAPPGEPSGALLVDIVTLDGIRIGTWKRPSRTRPAPEITIARTLTRAERTAVEEATARYARFAT